MAEKNSKTKQLNSSSSSPPLFFLRLCCFCLYDLHRVISHNLVLNFGITGPCWSCDSSWPCRAAHRTGVGGCWRTALNGTHMERGCSGTQPHPVRSIQGYFKSPERVTCDITYAVRDPVMVQYLILSGVMGEPNIKPPGRFSGEKTWLWSGKHGASRGGKYLYLFRLKGRFRSKQPVERSPRMKSLSPQSHLPENWPEYKSRCASTSQSATLKWNRTSAVWIQTLVRWDV